MNLNSRGDLYGIKIPKTFFHDGTIEKFKEYIKQLDITYNDVDDFVNSTIQSVSIPNINFDPIVQQRSGFDIRKRGRTTLYKAANDVQELFDRSFTVTFAMTSGYINYWVMLDLFLYWYSFPNPEPFVFDLPIFIKDDNGRIIFKVIFEKVLYNGLSEYELNFTDNGPTIKTFDATFGFNNLKFEFMNS